MKNIILFLALIICKLGYSQNYYQKKEILTLNAISFIIDDQRLYIDIKNTKPIHFQIWKKNEMILNATGRAKGKESFPISKGKYKLIIFNDQGKAKTKFFHI